VAFAARVAVVSTARQSARVAGAPFWNPGAGLRRFPRERGLVSLPASATHRALIQLAA
jgi:hypothetical protein